MLRPTTPAAGGFTLVELLIALALLGVLATLAYPSYLAQVLRSHRLDALVALAQVQQAQERWRANHAAFAPDLETLGLSAQPGDRYRLAIRDSAAHGYTAVATAIAAQAADTACASLIIVQSGGNTSYRSTGSATPQRCWNR
jgi:type IV pilus assembly protein PilE